MSEHKHAIIVIKNENNEYLQYYDNRWDCYLFLNCKVTEENKVSFICDEIKKKLNINKEEIDIKYIDEKIHTKYSVSAKIEKEYHHYFYKVNIKNKYENKEFRIENIDFKWYSMGELEKDKRIQEVNNDIVSIIKSLNM